MQVLSSPIDCSTIVRTTANCFEMADISPSRSYDPLLLAKRSPRITEMITVRFYSNRSLCADDLLVGKNNRRCLCASCERKGIGGYIIESDWSLHSSETEGEGGNVQQASGLQPGMAKKRRSELDNLKENLTDLMKAPILPVSGSEDSDTAEKEREREREKRREKKKEKGKKKRDRHAEPAAASANISAKEKLVSKDGSTSTISGKVAQLPTPSTTHSYASTSGGTPKQDDIHDDEHDVINAVSPKKTRRSQADQHLITPPPSTKTHSGDEAGNGSDDDLSPRVTRSRKPPPTQPTVNSPVKRGRGRPRKYPLPNPAPVIAKVTAIQPGSDKEQEGDGSSNDSDSSGDDEDGSTGSASSDEEEQRRVYAFRRRKLKAVPVAQTAASSNRLARRVNGSGAGTGTPSGGTVGRPGGAGGSGGAAAGKQGKFCITCKWNELVTKNELTCGRLVFHFFISLNGTDKFRSVVSVISTSMVHNGRIVLVTQLSSRRAVKDLHQRSNDLGTFCHVIIRRPTAIHRPNYVMPNQTPASMMAILARSNVAVPILAQTVNSAVRSV